MDKIYNHKNVEERIYKKWESSGYFKPEINSKGKPYCIILPPPNANGALHFGHAMFTIEDILIRYHRMKGEAVLWLPGTDHAGIETQFVFEKKLKEMGKSRLDFDRDTLYKMIDEYVNEHRGGIENQLRSLGFSLDWSREKYTLDPDIVKLVYATFKKMYDDGLIYRDYRLVNYCTFDGTSFSDLEVVHEEKKDPLYYIKYGPLILATTRPETKFGDTAIAVNPNDKRYKKYVGKELEIETVLGKAKLKVIADDYVDPKFGTGVVKITPAHDFNDFEVGKRHNLSLKQVIGLDGKMTKDAGKFEGLYAKQARKVIVEEMQRKGLIEKIDKNYSHNIGLCYKCKNVLEPLPLEQWFIKMDSLAKEAVIAIKEGKVKIVPKRFEKVLIEFLENIKDWNISRQVVWGIRIPAWKNKKTGEWVVSDEISVKGDEWEQDPDTFDTWFSSSQWPFATLQTTGDFKNFYPTSVMETGYDILRWWVARMIMVGIYVTKKAPFNTVVLHGLVNDPLGKKMSKSKGNVVNPLELVDEYGADAVRFALVFGTALGNDQALSYPKFQNGRNFANKLWNIARYVDLITKDKKVEYFGEKVGTYTTQDENSNEEKWCFSVFTESTKLFEKVTKALDNYRFNDASEILYDFIWHTFADQYIEESKVFLKDENKSTPYVRGTLLDIMNWSLKLLHPIMPFITEDLYSRLPHKHKSTPLIISEWPK